MVAIRLGSTALALLLAAIGLLAPPLQPVLAANPIVEGVGMADPHMHVWPANPHKVMLYATHDCSPHGKTPCVAERNTPRPADAGIGAPRFFMNDWWVWSSTNLVDWTMETKVKPSVLSWENVNTTNECWATDAASFPNGSTYFYLSVGPKQIGVVSGPTPSGPFTDTLGKPLIPIGLVPTYSRDPGVLQDTDGSNYLIFGTFSYYMAKLNPDMISLSEKPRGVKINHEQHRDDKPFLHRMRDTYYLSWGCFYAMGSSPYGPFNYSGSIINTTALANTSFASGGGTKDRHGSFFTLRGQSYFTCNDESHGGGGGFRSTIIAYAHYRLNGTIANIRIDATGVGQYNVSGDVDTIEAEDFYEISGASKQQKPVGHEGSEFQVVGLRDRSTLAYPSVHGGAGRTVYLAVANGGKIAGTAEVFVAGKSIGSCAVKPTGAWGKYASVECGKIDASASAVDLLLKFHGGGSSTIEFARLDSIRLSQ